VRKAIILLGLMAVAATPSSPVASLAGRYSKHFQNGMVDGSKFWSDDVVEIVPVDAAHAYFRADLAFYNGHSCSIAGVAKAVGGKLVYREKQPMYDGGPTCRLTIATKGKSLLLDDGDGGCQTYCGARGTLSGFDFIPLSSKRPIGYMPRLKRSSQYKDAVDAWK
jgi:hypothetical protein